MLWSGQNPGNPWTSSVICAVSMNAIDKAFDSVSLGNSFATSSFDQKKKKNSNNSNITREKAKRLHNSKRKMERTINISLSCLLR